MITDSHAHLYWSSYDADREQVLARARAAGVERMVVVGTNVATSRAAHALCSKEPGLHPTAGIHPHDASDADLVARAEIERLCRDPACVGVGETGLDFFKEYAPRAAQLESFRWQLALARELDKAIVIHCRDAHEEMLEVLRERRGNGTPRVRGVMHCYTMGAEELPGYLELGLYISFSGVVSFPPNARNREAARVVPEDRLLVETDCPFLAPQGHRGKRNEPALARVVLETVATLRGRPLEELARATSANAARLFGLPEVEARSA